MLFIREKSLYAGSLTSGSSLLLESVNSTDAHDFKYMGEWLLSLSDESSKRGIGNINSRIMAAILHKAGLNAEAVLSAINDNSGDRLKLFLNSIDLKKAKIRTPEDLVAYLESAVNAGVINERAFNDALATTIINANVSKEDIRANLGLGGRHCWLWWLLGAGLLFFFLFLFYRRKKKKTEEKEKIDLIYRRKE